jgi:hypothetical protein
VATPIEVRPSHPKRFRQVTGVAIRAGAADRFVDESHAVGECPTRRSFLLASPAVGDTIVQ